MTVPASKADLLAAITTTFDKLMADLSNVPVDRARERTLDGHAAGTKMSPADLVSYLVGWNELVLKWLDQDDSGTKVDFPDAGFQWKQLGLLAQRFYGDYEALGYSQLLDRLTTAKGRLVETISSRSDDELYGAPWWEMDKGADDSVQHVIALCQCAWSYSEVAQDAGGLTFIRRHPGSKSVRQESASGPKRTSASATSEVGLHMSMRVQRGAIGLFLALDGLVRSVRQRFIAAAAATRPAAGRRWRDRR